MYCDFNVKLFKPFISMKTKIMPAMADDWEMIPSTYNRLGGFSLKSEKLNQQVADIDLLRFLQFSKEQNLVIEGLKLKGNFIVGNNRSVYTFEMWDKWLEKFTKRTEHIIDKKDYIPGHKYKTPCGAETIYLGVKYSSRFKTSNYTDITKVAKKYYTLSLDAYERGNYKPHNSFYIHECKMKFSIDLGMVLSPTEAETAMDNYYLHNSNLICWEDVKPKTEEYKLVETNVVTVTDDKWTNYHNYNFVEVNGSLCTPRSIKEVDGVLVDDYDRCSIYDRDTLEITKNGGWNYGRRNNKPITKFYRLKLNKENENA